MFRRVANLLPIMGWAMLLAMLPVTVAMVYGLIHLPLTPGKVLGTGDPDVWLRLSLVRNWMEGASWYDHHYPSNAPFAPPESHWTRPLDMVIAFFTMLQPGANLSLKLLRTAQLLPVLWMATFLAGMMAALRRVSPWPATRLTLAALALAVPMLSNYFGDGNADHHAMLAACWAWVLYLLIASEDAPTARRCIGLGAVLAFMLWISVEAIVLIGMVGAWLVARWLAGESPQRLRLVTLSAALGATCALLVSIPPPAWLRPVADTLSITHVIALIVAANAALALPHARARRWGWLLAIGMVAAGVLYWLNPLFFAGPMAQVDPFITNVFLKRIHEAQSAFDDSFAYGMALLLQPVIALLVAFRCVRHDDGILAPRHAALLAWFMAATGLFGILQLRWYYYCGPVVLLILAPWLTAWIAPEQPSARGRWPANRLLFLDAKQQAWRRMPLLLAIVVLPLLLAMLGESEPDYKDKRARRCEFNIRRVLQSGELERLGRGRPFTVLAPTNSGGEILFFSHHRILASNYHREGKTIDLVWQAFTTPDIATFRKILRTRRIHAVLLCPDRRASEQAVANRLFAGSLQLPELHRHRLTTPKLTKTQPQLYFVRPR